MTTLKKYIPIRLQVYTRKSWICFLQTLSAQKAPEHQIYFHQLLLWSMCAKALTELSHNIVLCVFIPTNFKGVGHQSNQGLVSGFFLYFFFFMLRNYEMLSYKCLRLTQCCVPFLHMLSIMFQWQVTASVSLVVWKWNLQIFVYNLELHPN